MELYHGTNEKFKKFKNKFSGRFGKKFGKGFYFTNKDNAKKYAYNSALNYGKNPILVKVKVKKKYLKYTNNNSYLVKKSKNIKIIKHKNINNFGFKIIRPIGFITKFF